MNEVLESFLDCALGDYNEVYNFLDSYLQKRKHILFDAKMGAGKTLFVKEYLKQRFNLSEQEILKNGFSSPSFSILNIYEIKGFKVLHYDFYRIEDRCYDLEDDFSEIENSDLIFVEWPQNVDYSSYFIDLIDVKIEKCSDNTRNIKITTN